MNQVFIKGCILPPDIDSGLFERNMERRKITKMVMRHDKYKDIPTNVEAMICHLESETRELRQAVESGDIDDALFECADISNCADKINVLLELSRD